MKKSFLMLGLAVAAMTSCTNDEVVEMNQTNLIKFDAFVNKNTRAVTDVTVSNLEKFYVLGYRRVEDDLINLWGGEHNMVKKTTTEEGGVSWENSKSEKWDDGTYSFFAYANGSSGDELDYVTIDGGTGYLVMPNFVKEDDTDLIGAFTQVSGANKYKTVNLSFMHLFSKVSFEFVNNYTDIDDATMKISNLTVHAFRKHATLIIKPSNSVDEMIDWQLQEPYEAYKDFSKVYDDQTVEFDGLYSDSHLFIPQELTASDEGGNSNANRIGDIYISFTVSYYDGDNFIVSKTYENVPLKGTLNDNNKTSITEWKPGYHYKYTASLPVSPNEITFNVSAVQGWVENEVDDDDRGEDVEF